MPKVRQPRSKEQDLDLDLSESSVGSYAGRNVDADKHSILSMSVHIPILCDKGYGVYWGYLPSRVCVW